MDVDRKDPIKKHRNKCNVHKRIKESAKKIIEEIEQGKDITESMDAVINNLDEKASEEIAIQKRFKEIEKKLKSIKSSKILSRHQNALDQYRGMTTTWHHY